MHDYFFRILMKERQRELEEEFGRIHRARNGHGAVVETWKKSFRKLRKALRSKLARTGTWHRPGLKPAGRSRNSCPT